MVNIERDATGKTRVAKGDKSGLSGQYAPDFELLKKYAADAKKLNKHNLAQDETEIMSVEEYNDAVASREALIQHYNEYNKSQQEIAINSDPNEYVNDGTFTYFADFSYDSPVKTSISSPRSEDGQPKGWSLRLGSRTSSSKTGLDYFATREEALAAVDIMQDVRKNNPYVKEQLAQYNVEKENKEAVRLPSSTPKGPWDMKLVFIEPKPNAASPAENGYHAGWCLVAKSDNFNNGEPVFINNQGYKTREEAVKEMNIVNETIEGWRDHKDRVIFVEGKGNILYNNMSHEQYEQVINHFGFKPRPWAAADHFTDYYPKSNYQGD